MTATDRAADLTIPPAAVAALHEAGDEPMTEYVRAIAAPVVAAELRRLSYEADHLRMEHTSVGDDPARAAAVRAYADMRNRLAARADELDPS